MSKKIFLLLLSVAIQLSVYAQQSDSLQLLSQRLAKKTTFSKSLKVSGLLVGGGFIALSDNDLFSNEEIKEERNEHIPTFRSHTDDYLQYAPIAMCYGMDLLGFEAKHDILNRSVILIKSELLMMAIVFPTKQLTHHLRPDGSSYNSFPSGHTAQAFVAATFLHKEYGHISPWVSVSAYTMASAVGVLRVLNNRHYASDVLVGAGVGILATNLAYYTHRYKWGKRMTLIPTYNQKHLGLSMNYQF